MNFRQKLEALRQDTQALLLRAGINQQLTVRVMEEWWKLVENYFPQEKSPDRGLIKQYEKATENIESEYIREIHENCAAAPIFWGIFSSGVILPLTELANRHGLDVDEFLRALTSYASSTGELIWKEKSTYQMIARQRVRYRKGELRKNPRAFVDAVTKETVIIIRNLDNNFEKEQSQMSALIEQQKHNVNLLLRQAFRQAEPETGIFFQVLTHSKGLNFEKIEHEVVYYVALTAVEWAVRLAY